MSKLIILTGAAGSGKSTLARNMIEDFLERGVYVNYILSTDNYFVRPDGRYMWYAQELEQAHEHTFQTFKDIVEEVGCETDPMWEPPENVILDNTNLVFRDIERYAKLAFQNGWEVEIVEPQTQWANDAEELFRRNTHGVPFKTIERQLARKEPIEALRTKLEALRVEVCGTESAN
jgi:adenylate kinase family enzyme